MALNESRRRSELPNLADTKRLLHKIAGLLAESPRHVVFQKGSYRANAADLMNVTIDETLVSDNITFQRKPFDDVAGELELQDLTYTGVAGDADDNDVSIEYQDFTPAVAASLEIQDLTYTADTAGVAGNSITVTYVDDGTAGSETVNVVGSAITVHMEDGASTATQIKAAVDASGPAAALVNVAITGTGSNFQAAASADNLTGGADAVGAAGSEQVTVVGNAIIVKLQSGVSTATQVKAAIEGSMAASALVTVAISGTGSNAQVTASAENLSGGVTAAAIESYDIADIKMIRRLRTKKWMIEIKDSANPA